MPSYHGFLEFIGLDASDEKWIALAQGLHQGLQRLLELRGQGGRPGNNVSQKIDFVEENNLILLPLPGLGPHLEVLAEQVLEELVLGHVDQLEEVGAEGVSVLLEEVPRVVEHHPGEVVEAEGCVDVRLGLQIVSVVPMLLMQLVQHSLV